MSRQKESKNRNFLFMKKIECEKVRKIFKHLKTPEEIDLKSNCCDMSKSFAFKEPYEAKK